MKDVGPHDIAAHSGFAPSYAVKYLTIFSNGTTPAELRCVSGTDGRYTFKITINFTRMLVFRKYELCDTQ